MKQQTVCIIGLGYVGLPLAHAVSAAGHTVIGYDINSKRINELIEGNDKTGEVSNAQLKEVSIDFTEDANRIKEANIVILALPTPVDKDHKPDLSILEEATKTVGKNLKEGSIIVYESTVYPGVTEEICGEILEKESGLVCGTDFCLGYSPERVNPGDKKHTVASIVKVVSGQDEDTTDTLCEFYESFVEVGIHRAPSIKVAEMAKAIENAQRDLNIAFVNEIAMLSSAIGVETKDVLEAAKTKWNFLPFTPGLVGGHCIGVDPYYLVEKANQLGKETKVITAGRSTNDGMGAFVANQINELVEDNQNILILGITFKENVPDTRNSKSGDVIRELENMGHTVSVNDAYVKEDEIEKIGFHPSKDTDEKYDVVALLVPHNIYLEDSAKKILGYCKNGGLIYDLKSVLDKKTIEGTGLKYKAL
jgi:UDP-N-acetyl-D-glucosamine/UDP-N-acetyl-D-galactosamine dehydrogenase